MKKAMFFLTVSLVFLLFMPSCFSQVKQKITNPSGHWELMTNSDLTDSTIIFTRKENEEAFCRNTEYCISISPTGGGYAHGYFFCGNDSDIWAFDRWSFDASTNSVVHQFKLRDTIKYAVIYEVDLLNAKKLQLSMCNEYFNEGSE